MPTLSDRDQTELGRLKADIDAFVSFYNNNMVSNEPPPTVIFLPGGLASNLWRRRPSPNTSKFDKIWISLQTLSQTNVDLLGMVDDDTDVQNGLVVPQGSLEICDVYDPYGEFKAWCRDNTINLFVLGYDWRRRPTDFVQFFFEIFLPRLQEGVLRDRADRHLPARDPLDNLTLIGHSLGGPLIKLIVHYKSPLVTKIKCAITVASPFYGYTEQTVRYFQGETEFKKLKFDMAELAKLIASLRGGYFLQFMDADTYEQNVVAFQKATYPLRGYPSIDPETKEYADPYSPGEPDGSGKTRYPSFVKTDELSLAKTIVQTLAADLPESFKNRFFCMRGIQAETRTWNPIAKTNIAQSWKRVRPDFNPNTDPSPLDWTAGPGDGSQPAWTTRPLSLPPGQGFDYVGDVEHTRMMDCTELRNDLIKLITAPDVPAYARSNPGRTVHVLNAQFGQDTAREDETIDTLVALAALGQHSQGPRGVRAQLTESLARRLFMMLNHSHLPNDPPAGTRP